MIRLLTIGHWEPFSMKWLVELLLSIVETDKLCLEILYINQ